MDGTSAHANKQRYHTEDSGALYIYRAKKTKTLGKEPNSYINRISFHYILINRLEHNGSKPQPKIGILTMEERGSDERERSVERRCRGSGFNRGSHGSLQTAIQRPIHGGDSGGDSLILKHDEAAQTPLHLDSRFARFAIQTYHNICLCDHPCTLQLKQPLAYSFKQLHVTKGLILLSHASVVGVAELDTTYVGNW
jgi:hypothetical protein